MKYIKSYNESLKGVLKPKSNQDILDSIKHLSDSKKMIQACKYHMTWLVQKLINDGVDPSFNNNMCLINCGILEYNDIVEILMKNQKVINQLYKTQLDQAHVTLEYEDEYDYDEEDEEWEGEENNGTLIPIIDWYYYENGDEEDEEWENEEDYEE